MIYETFQMNSYPRALLEKIRERGMQSAGRLHTIYLFILFALDGCNIAIIKFHNNAIDKLEII